MKPSSGIARITATARRRAARLGQLSGHQWALLAEAGLLLAYARLSLLLEPFSSVAHRLGGAVAAPGHSENAAHARGLGDGAVAHEISCIIALAARAAPFRAVCLHQAITARMMLRRRAIPSIMSIGVSRSETAGRPSIKAHAWVRAGDVPVVGVEIADDYDEIARFT